MLILNRYIIPYMPQPLDIIAYLLLALSITNIPLTLLRALIGAWLEAGRKIYEILRSKRLIGADLHDIFAASTIKIDSKLIYRSRIVIA